MDDNVMYRIDDNGINFEVPEEEYDPYLRRDSKVQITNFQALFLLIQGFIGTTVIQALFVYREGWLAGTIYIILIAILCNHCLHILINSKYRLCKLLQVSNLNYAESIERALETGPPSLRIFSRISYHVVDTCLILCQLALCCSYSATIVVLVPSIANIFLKQWFNIETSTTVLFFISLIPLVLAPLMKDLKMLSNACVFGVILLFGAFGFFYWYAFEDFSSLDDFSVTMPNVANLPAFLGPIFISLQAINVVSFIEGDLRSPRKFKKFWGTLNLGVLIVVIFECSIGILAYFKFGQVSGNLIFAISNESVQQLKVCIFLYALSLYVSYGLQGYIFVELIWRKTEKRKSKVCLRIILFLLSFAFMVTKSMNISYIADLIMKIIFVITVPMLGIIFPVVLDICVKWPHDFRRANYYLCVNLMLIIIGILVVLVPLYINFV